MDFAIAYFAMHHTLGWGLLVGNFNGTLLDCVFPVYENAALLATALKHPAIHSLLELNQRFPKIALLFF
jgi:hypothetical protein